MMKVQHNIVMVCTALFLTFQSTANEPPCLSTVDEETIQEEWEYLIDENLSQWEIWMGVPHVTTGLPNATSTDGKQGTPLGLDNDPLDVFSVINEGGELQLKITGEVYGGLTTLKEYSDYHFSVQFKWGEAKYEPRLTDKRDSGILYHCQGDHGAFWNVWKSSLEFQVQEGDCADFIGLSGANAKIQSQNKVFAPGETAVESGFIRKSDNYEVPNGEWNTLEVITVGDKSMHFVNGYMVNALEDTKYKGAVLKDGQIQIQSEGAELYYRDMKIKSVSDFPEEEKALLGWDGSTPIEMEVPIGKIIGLQKSGGDQRYVTINTGDQDALVADEESEEGSALFIVEEHPDGGVGLRATSNGKYVQVQGADTSKPLRVAGEAMGTWEQFEWKFKGINKIALKSMFTGTWVQAAWNADNVLLYPKGEADGTWETFRYRTIDTFLGITDAPGAQTVAFDFYPNPTHTTLTLKNITTTDRISIVDLSGRVVAVAKGAMNNATRNLDVSHLPKGMYVISVNNQGGRVFVKQ